MRNPNTDKNGQNFDVRMIANTWLKGNVIPGYDANVFRQDICGAWIQIDKYGNTNHEYGWEIDHINPVSNGGSDNLSNLQPLHWKNNRHKGDKLKWDCLVSAR